jgi:glycosyltransferase involved in cell wall biosynthesis
MIVALIPAYNASHTISLVIFKTKEYADTVIVYDDGSTDETSYIAKKCGAVVLEGERNRGKGYALKHLLDYGKKHASEGTVFVTIDADMQHNPKDIPKLVEPIISGEFDVVCGARQNFSFRRKIANKVLDKIAKHKESQIGFRAYSYKAIKDLEIETDGFGVDSEIIMKLSKFRIEFVPVWIEYGKYSHKKNPVSHFAEVFNFLFFQRPLVNLSGIGLVSFILGMVLIGEVIRTWGVHKELAIGTFLFAMLLVMLGALSFFTGVILHAIRKEVRKK